MSNFTLIHSKEARFTAKKSNKINLNDVKEIAHSDSLLKDLRNVGVRNIKAKTFTEVSSIGLTGESKTVYYFKDDELFHFIDDGKVFDAKSEKDIDRQIKSRFRKGLWGDKENFHRLKIYELTHSAKGTTWTKNDHKYIRKEGDRYIYEEDLKNSEIYDVEKAMLQVNNKYKGELNCFGCTFAIDYLLRNKNRNLNIDVKEFESPALMEEIEERYTDVDGNNRYFTTTDLLKRGSYLYELNSNKNFLDNFNRDKVNNEAVKGMLSQGDSRGYLCVELMSRDPSTKINYTFGGHVVMYIVENGSIYIIDGQTGDKYKSDDFFNKVIRKDSNDLPIQMNSKAYMRVDDLNIDYDIKYYDKNFRVEPEKERSKQNIYRRPKL